MLAGAGWPDWWMTAAELGCIEPTPINKALNVINRRRNMRAISP